MKPDFNKNQVLRSMSLATDNTAFNIDGPSQLMSPTGARDSFLGERFNSKMIISGNPTTVVAGASRINQSNNLHRPQDSMGFQNGIAPPAFDDVSAIMNPVDEPDSINNGAYRRKQIQSSVQVRAGYNLDDSDELNFELDENSKKKGILSHEDINVYLSKDGAAKPSNGL